MSDFFKKFKVAKPAFQVLSEGEHVVRATKFAVTDSFMQYNGTQKDELPEWANATPQLAITVVDVNGKGGLTHRLNGCGFVKFDDLTSEQLESGNYTEINGYACYEDKDGDTVRLECPDKTEACANIMNQFATALGIAEGTNIIKGLERAIEDKYEMRVTVVNDSYEGKDQYRLSKFKAVALETAEQTFED